MLKISNSSFSRITLLRKAIFSKVDLCQEKYIKNDVIIFEKNSILEYDYNFYDELLCPTTNDFVFLDKNEYKEFSFNFSNNFFEENKNIIIYTKNNYVFTTFNDFEKKSGIQYSN